MINVISAAICVHVGNKMAQMLSEEQKMELAKVLDPAADMDVDSAVPLDVSSSAFYTCLSVDWCVINVLYKTDTRTILDGKNGIRRSWKIVTNKEEMKVISYIQV